ncbi:MAG: biotin transporter BioY [Clostridia bacterium]|nr:biotin transporter BioY [Clostridia bacterium]
MKKDGIKALTYISLCVAIMAALSQLAIPIGTVPLTLQAFSVSLIGYFLGLKNGVAAITVYILLGLVGVPVFANFQGGLHTVIGYTGGFILGYLPYACLCGIKGEKWKKITLGIIGLLLCHLCGILWYMHLAELNIWLAFIAVSAPYLLKDIALTVCAYFVSEALHKRLRN